MEVEYASEFRYGCPYITDRDVVIAISQSGETADTLAAIQLAKSKEAFVYGICNWWAHPSPVIPIRERIYMSGRKLVSLPPRRLPGR